MVVYYSLFFSVCILSLLFRPKSKFKYNNQISNYANLTFFYVIIVSLLIGSVIGFRSIRVGADTSNYISIYYYDVINNGVFGKNPEIVLRLIAWICHHILPYNYQVFLIVIGYITALLFAKFIYDNSNNVFISFIIFIGMFFVQSMNLMREWLAISFVINAYTYYKRENIKKAIILFLLAVLTHLTAISFFIIPFLNLISNRRRAFILALVGSLAFYLLRDTLLRFFVAIVPKYSTYIYSSDMVNEAAFNIKDLIFIVILFVFVFSLFFKRDFFSKEEQSLFFEYSILLLIALTISLCGQRYFMLHRIVFYFSVFLLVSIPNYVEKLHFKFYVYLLLLGAMFYMLYRNSYNDNNVISNYYWFWE